MIVIVGVAIVLGESLDFMKLLGCAIGKCSLFVSSLGYFLCFSTTFLTYCVPYSFCVLLVSLSGIGGVFLYSIIDNIVKPKEE